MDEICRLCGQSYHNMLNLYSEESRDCNMLAKIRRNLHLTIKKDDKLTKLICETCTGKVNEFHNFSVQVEQTQKLLRSIKSTQKTDTPKTSLVVEWKETQTHQHLVLNNPENSDSNAFTNDFSTENHCDDRDEGTVTFNGQTYPKLLKDGKLTVRGKELETLFARFFDLTCDICQVKNREKFSDTRSLFNHYKEKHSTEGFVQCCGVKFNKRLKIYYHMAQHLQPEVFTCTVCNKVLYRPYMLEEHMMTHLPEQEKKYACKECPKKFSNLHVFNTHQAIHLPPEKRATFPCPECGKTLRTAGNLRTHIKMQHEGSYDVCSCHVCGKICKEKSQLKCHIRTHENIHQMQCEMCNKWLKNKRQLKIHSAIHSSERKKCPLCDYTSPKQSCINKHLKIKHSEEKPFVCEYCSHAFKLKKSLQVHLAQHTGERKYKCEFCSKSFASNGNYFSHRKHMHFKEVEELNRINEEQKRLEREVALGKCTDNKTELD